MYLIDRGELLMQMMHKFHYELPDGCNNSLYGDVIKVIEDAPLIEAEPVRHGVWMCGDYYDVGDVCPECDWDSLISPCDYRYCPNCGAKMDNGE